MADNSLVPGFIIYFNGSRLPVEKEADVKEIIVSDKLNAPSVFTIKVSDPDKEWSGNEDYYIGAEVKILLGYKDALEEVMLGEVTGMSLQLRRNQPDIVCIHGQNHMHRLCRNARCTAFNQKTDKDIIEQIAGEAGLSTEVESLTFEHLFTLQNSQTDYNYLLEMAARYDCFMWVRNKKLFFKRLERNSAEDITLEYGKTLKELNPRADTSRIISEIEVRGLDLTNHSALVGSAAFGDIDSTGGSLVDKNWGGAKAVYIDQAVMDQTGADQLALDTITHIAREYITGTGRCEGDPVILAGTIIKLVGLGKKFSDKYFISQTTHSLKTDSAYETFFTFLSNIGSATSSGTDAETTSTTRSGESSGAEQSAETSAGNETGQNQQNAEAPSITNLKWIKDNEEIKAAHTTETVTLTAEVQNINDGLWARMRLYEKGYEDENSPLFSQSGQVRNGKVEIKWSVEHKGKDTAARDNGESTALPEYLFIMDASQPEAVKSGESPALKLYQWVEIELLDGSNKPYKEVKYIIADKDGNTIKEGNLDDKGYAKVMEIDTDQIKISFPDLKEKIVLDKE